MKKIALMSLVASSILMAGAYKVPENSTNAVALGAANVAHNHNSADAAYYNPAKMVFMSDENHADMSVKYIGLSQTEYTAADGTQSKAESENFLVPSFHYVSSKLGESGARVGLSLLSPGGLSKRWETAPGKASAEEFSLRTIELNPSVGFAINDKVGFAVGFRIVHSAGIAKATPSEGNVYQDMKGDSVDFGYNIALAYQPTPALELGVTYRSKIDLTLDGDADLKYTTPHIDGNYAGSVDIPLPAALNLAAAYTFPTKTTVEFVYERTLWSVNEEMDFEYTNPTAEAVFGRVKDKSWHDTSSYRIGITQKLDALTLMGGFVIDESPIPSNTLGFELPSSDSVAYSLGGRYQINKKMDVAFGALYSISEKRDSTKVNGSFENSNVLMVSAGLGYRF